MNSKTAKAIRRFCVSKKVDYTRAKHYWNKVVPRNQRHDARQSMLVSR